MSKLKSANIFLTGPTLGQRLTAAGGKPSGFDYMRVILALMIIGMHSISISYGDAVQQELGTYKLWRIVTASIVPIFFGLSGFLVAGSLERCKTMFSFLALRVLRIVPALVTEVVLSACVIGPLLTTIPLSAYFYNSQFSSYFLNILGDIHYMLPGLFPDNPYPNIVNMQLWTIPWELACYVTLTILALCGVVRRRSFLVWLILALYIIYLTATLLKSNNAVGVVPGKSLVITFLSGVLLYQYRDKVKSSPSLFFVSVALVAALLCIPSGDRFVGLPAAYMTVYLGLMHPRRNKYLLSGDYSYGLYLYGYPLQQAFASLGPAVREWYWNLLAVIPVAFLVAAASWWCIEKPALGLRSRLKSPELAYISFKKALRKWLLC